MTARDTTYPFMAQLKQVFKYCNNTYRDDADIYASDMFDGVFNANGYRFIFRCPHPPFSSIYEKNNIYYTYHVEFIDLTYDDKRILSFRMIKNFIQYNNDDSYDSIDDILLTDISDDEDDE